MKAIFLLILTLACYSNDGEGAKILGFFAHPGKSHFDIFKVLMKELARRGHSVTVVSFFPQKPPIENYTDVSLEGLMPIYLNIVSFEAFSKYEIFLPFLPYINFFQLYEMGLETCENVLSSKQVQQLISSSEKYDLIVTEVFNTDCFLSVVYKLKAPFIAMSSCSFMPWFNGRFGNPSNPSYVPNMFYGSSDKMSFPERMHNTFIEIFTTSLYHPFFTVPAQRLANKYIGEDVPPLQEIAKNTSMLLINSHYTLHGPKPLVPGIVEIGGIHIEPAKKLPQDIEKFINESQHGVILFSLGSMLKAESLDDKRRSAFLNAFKNIKQRIIWKFEKDLTDLPENVKIYPWIPQRDILEHPNVKAFIAHGGLLGLTEAVHCGKPILGIPMYGDQHLNLRYSVKKGFAVELPFTDITEEKVAEGIRKILSKEYYDNAQKISKEFRDRLVSPLESAVYWTEYVLRHKGAKHLQSAAVDLSFYEYFLIDVISVILIVIITTFYVSYKIFSFIIKKTRNFIKASKKVKTT